MANPSLPKNEKKTNLDGLYVEAEGLIVNNKVVIVDRQSYVADAADTNLGLVITPGTGAASQDMTAGTGTMSMTGYMSSIGGADLGQFVVNVEAELALLKTDMANKTTKINSLLDILEAHGLMAAS